MCTDRGINRMKITKRQLRRIIREEATRPIAVGPAPTVTGGELRYAHSGNYQQQRKEALEMLEELRAAGVSDRRLVEYLLNEYLGARVDAIYTLKDFKQFKM